jgi:hypothetical protein
MRFEDCIDIAGRTACVIGHCHRRATNYIEIGDHAPSRQPLPQPSKGLLDLLAAKQRFARHATSNSCGATKTPRRRNAAGACTIASARAARVLNGNQKVSR